MGKDGRRGAWQARYGQDATGAGSGPAGVPGQRPSAGTERQEMKARMSLAEWLQVTRPEAEPGIWRYGHVAAAPDEPERIPGRQLIGGALITFLAGWLFWSLIWNGYLGSYWLWPLLALTPESWREADGEKAAYIVSSYLYYAIVLGGIAIACARVGRWGELWRRYGAPVLLRVTGRPRAGAARRTHGEPAEDPAEWPRLRAAGAEAAAERLAADARAGAMNDVDAARIAQVWEAARARPEAVAQFTDGVLRYGAGAWAHPSGARDLPGPRIARHDLVCRQVRLGGAVTDDRNPGAYRGAGVALSPALLGTSLLAVGPPGAGKTDRLVTPVTEALCLQALARQAAVVAVVAEGEAPLPDEAFDVVVKLGRPDSAYDLDLYGGTDDPDAAAAVLAEALVGDMAEALPGGDSRRAATALAQLLGPYHAVHRRFPRVPELRRLLDGGSGAVAELRNALEEAGHEALLRELDARERQAERTGDAADLLADRLALLDRPAFAPFFDSSGETRQFSLRTLEHPMRVRIDLPEYRHTEASRVLARLILAQFAEAAVDRQDRSLFACLVFDDATHTITPLSLRRIGRLRSANSGVVLTLPTLDAVPERLRGALLGAVGCRIAFAGVTTWDGARFAEVWGKEWIETRDVTDREIVADEPFTKFVHFVRRLVTGRQVTSKAVTVRTVERERWSASELANTLPPGHAVVSVTTTRGERTPPVLVDLHH